MQQSAICIYILLFQSNSLDLLIFHFLQIPLVSETAYHTQPLDTPESHIEILLRVTQNRYYRTHQSIKRSFFNIRGQSQKSSTETTIHLVLQLALLKKHKRSYRDNYLLLAGLFFLFTIIHFWFTILLPAGETIMH